MSHRLVFFGTGSVARPTLQALLQSRHAIVAVVTQPDRPAGRHRRITPGMIAQMASNNGLKLLQPEKPAQILPELKQLSPDAGILVSYGRIVPQDVLDSFPLGIINAHPSLLPRYRGPTPITAAILNGDTETGVSLIRLTDRMDAGGIYAQVKVPLDGTETGPDLTARLASQAASLLLDRLGDIMSGKLTPTPQDESAATTVRLIKKSDGEIDWQKPADRLEREIRAYLGWPGSFTSLHGRHVTITKAHVAPLSGRPSATFITPQRELGVFASSGALIIDSLIPAGKREMSGRAFAAGLKP